MKFICVQPRILYFAWQIEVMLNNFLKNGINGNDIEILVATNPNDDTSTPENIEAFIKLQNKYNYVRFFYYEDTRKPNNYIPSIYFNILKQHIKAFPDINKQPIFCHDCDILFTKPVDFSNMVYDNIWYLSNTNSYINAKYILSKGENLYNKMTDIVGLHPTIPKLMNSNSGGAQHIIKNTTYEYWDKVEKNAIELYEYFCQEEPNYNKRHECDYPIQKWTAGMWSLLWNAWLFENETKVDSRLNFCMATDDILKWDRDLIFHNAGVTENDTNLFKKFDYRSRVPYGENFDHIDHDKCSYNYVKEVIETGKNSCLI